VNIKWKEMAPAPVKCYGHKAVWLDGLLYVGGGMESEKGTHINCYDPVSNSWISRISTSYRHFSMAIMNNKLLIAGGMDKRDKMTNQILAMDDGQLKNYTKMGLARSNATAIGHQGMLIITGGEDDKRKTLSSTELFDSGNGQWYICSDLPQPLSELQSSIVSNILYCRVANETYLCYYCSTHLCRPVDSILLQVMGPGHA